jgi:hypothetical protein
MGDIYKRADDLEQKINIADHAIVNIAANLLTWTRLRLP